MVASLQLDYDTLAAINPALIYCTTTGFGDDGKYAGRPAYDDLIQGASGVAALMSKNDEEARYFPGIICDKITGLTAVYAVLAAVIHRNNTGEGQKVTVPMFETMVAFNLLEHIQDTVFQGEASDFGYKRVLSEHRRPYNTKDGLICVLPYSDRNWRSFFSLIGQPELAQDPRFESLPQRTRHIDELYEISAGSLGDKTTQEWLTLFEEAHISATPIANLADIEQDCHIKTSGFIRPRTHPSAGDYKEIGIPIAYSQSVPDEPTPAPTIGQHSDDILQELGYSAADIAAMGEGVV